MKAQIREFTGKLGLVVAVSASVLNVNGSYWTALRFADNAWTCNPYRQPDYIFMHKLPADFIIGATGVVLAWYGQRGVVVARCAVLVAVGFWLVGLFTMNFEYLF